MIPKSVKRFSEHVMRKNERMMVVKQRAEGVTARTREA
jgi:hypothetical protein